MKFNKEAIIDTVGIICGAILVGSIVALVVAFVIKLITTIIMF